MIKRHNTNHIIELYSLSYVSIISNNLFRLTVPFSLNSMISSFMYYVHRHESIFFTILNVYNSYIWFFWRKKTTTVQHLIISQELPDTSTVRSAPMSRWVPDNRSIGRPRLEIRCGSIIISFGSCKCVPKHCVNL